MDRLIFRKRKCFKCSRKKWCLVAPDMKTYLCLECWMKQDISEGDKKLIKWRFFIERSD